MKRFRLIACEVLCREFCHAISNSPHTIDAEFLPKGLHDLGGAAMRRQLQERVDAASDGRYESILLGYALCGNGLQGLEARTTPLVLMRAHDCIALLMGDRRRFEEYFAENSGTYYRSTGWLERAADLDQESVGRTRKSTGGGYSLVELIARYGEDNGRYLFEQLHSYRTHYKKLCYLRLGFPCEDAFAERARQEAHERNWAFEELTGSRVQFERLANGEWPEEDFLIVPPGRRVEAAYDDRIIRIAGVPE